MPGPTEPAHGMDTIIKVGAADLSPWCKTSTVEKNPDIHDYTGYGRKTKRKVGGQLDQTMTASGWYDRSLTDGPKVILDDHCGETVAITRQLLGVGVGKPSQAFNAVIGKYTETSPCDDIVTWACDFAIDGDIDATAQTAEELAVAA